MLSLSHWGLFDVLPPVMIVPDGFEFDPKWLTSPGAIIWVTDPREVVYGRC